MKLVHLNSGALNTYTTGATGDSLIAAATPAAARVLLNVSEAITSATTIYVPADYSTVQAALNSLAGKRIAGVTVTIELTATETLSAGITFNHPDGYSVVLQGTAPTARSITAIGTVTGSASAWSVPLTFADASGLAADDYISIYTTTGTGNHASLRGFWKVASVSGSTVTITHTGKFAAWPTMTLTAASGYGKFICIHNTSTYASLTLNGYGLALKDLGFTRAGSTGTAIVATSAAQALLIQGHVGIHQDGQTAIGINMQIGRAVIDASAYLYSCGCGGSSAGSAGAVRNSSTTGGLFSSAGTVIAAGNYYGIYTTNAAPARLVTMLVAGNNTGIYAEKGAYITAGAGGTITLQDNTTDTNPTANTQGNEYAYIDT